MVVFVCIGINWHNVTMAGLILRFRVTVFGFGVPKTEKKRQVQNQCRNSRHQFFGMCLECHSRASVSAIVIWSDVIRFFSFGRPDLIHIIVLADF
jgi:hypothetical protein